MRSESAHDNRASTDPLLRIHPDEDNMTLFTSSCNFIIPLQQLVDVSHSILTRAAELWRWWVSGAIPLLATRGRKAQTLTPMSWK